MPRRINLCCRFSHVGGGALHPLGHLNDYFDQVCNSNFMLNPVCHALLVFMPVDSGMTPSSAGLPAPRRGLRTDIPQYPGRS